MLRSTSSNNCDLRAAWCVESGEQPGPLQLDLWGRSIGRQRGNLQQEVEYCLDDVSRIILDNFVWKEAVREGPCFDAAIMSRPAEMCDWITILSGSLNGLKILFGDPSHL